MLDGPGSATVVQRVQWVDTDASGHQHNGLIMRLFETAEAELMAVAGLQQEYFPSAPRVRQEINFSAMLYFGQDATTTIVVEALGRTSLTLAFEVWGEEWNGNPRCLAASGRVVVAHVPPGSAGSQPWPDATVRALTPQNSPHNPG